MVLANIRHPFSAAVQKTKSEFVNFLTYKKMADL